MQRQIERLEQEAEARRREAARRKCRDEDLLANAFAAGAIWAHHATKVDGALALPAGVAGKKQVQALLTATCGEWAQRLAQEGNDPLLMFAQPTLAAHAGDTEWGSAPRDIARLLLPPEPPTPPKQAEPRIPEHPPRIAYVVPESEVEDAARNLRRTWEARSVRSFGQVLSALREEKPDGDIDAIRGLLGDWTEHDTVGLAETFVLLHKAACHWAAAEFSDRKRARAAVADEVILAVSELPYPPSPRLARLFRRWIRWTTAPRPVTEREKVMKVKAKDKGRGTNDSAENDA